MDQIMIYRSSPVWSSKTGAMSIWLGLLILCCNPNSTNEGTTPSDYWGITQRGAKNSIQMVNLAPLKPSFCYAVYAAVAELTSEASTPLQIQEIHVFDTAKLGLTEILPVGHIQELISDQSRS